MGAIKKDRVLRRILGKLKYFLWALNGWFGLKFGLNVPQRATVLITYYNPARMKHINHQIRNILKCGFVEKIIISNHNPAIRIDTMVKIRDDRLTVLNQDIRRGCGYRWNIAGEYAPRYLIVVDDDILLFPWQLKTLFSRLVAEPEVPHGFAGMLHHEDGSLEYREMEDRSVDYLCEIYALTGDHLKRYQELRSHAIARDTTLEPVLDNSADFMVISKAGIGTPRIHKSSRLFRCPTYNQTGVAVHKETEFEHGVLDVAKALR
jgi:hypothetical protein